MGQSQLIMIDGETGEFKYEEVVQSPGHVARSEIQERAKRWLSAYYVSEDSVHVDSAGISKALLKRDQMDPDQKGH